MKQTLGKLVQAHRSTVGLGIERVAEQAHVPVDALMGFEQDRGSLTAAALDRVAAVLAIDPVALREGRIDSRPTVSLFFRQGAFPDFRHDDDRPKVAAAFERALALQETNALLARPLSFRARFQPEIPTPDAARDGYRLANQVRAALGNEVEPLPELPALLEERFDIFVRMEVLSSSRIDAVSIKEARTGAAAIIVNAASERRANPHTIRVDLAHELAHILFDPSNGEVNLIVDEDTDTARTVTYAEQRAGAFAAELLMPAEGLRRLLGKPTYEMSESPALDLVARVRGEFVTPIEITVNHLVNREYLVHWLREPLVERARRSESPRGVSNSTAAGIAKPDVLERRVLEALARGLISDARGRELLGLSPWDELPGGPRAAELLFSNRRRLLRSS